MYRGMYNGIVFAASDGFQWVRLGEQNLVEGLEEVLTREAVRRAGEDVRMGPYWVGTPGARGQVPCEASS